MWMSGMFMFNVMYDLEYDRDACWILMSWMRMWSLNVIVILECDQIWILEFCTIWPSIGGLGRERATAAAAAAVTQFCDWSIWRPASFGKLWVMSFAESSSRQWGKRGGTVSLVFYRTSPGKLSMSYPLLKNVRLSALAKTRKMDIESDHTLQKKQ